MGLVRGKPHIRKHLAVASLSPQALDRAALGSGKSLGEPGYHQSWRRAFHIANMVDSQLSGIHRCKRCLFLPADGPTGIEIHLDPGDGETPVSVGTGEYINCSASGRPTPNYHWEKKEGDVGDETYEGQELYVRVTFYRSSSYLVNQQ